MSAVLIRPITRFSLSRFCISTNFSSSKRRVEFSLRKSALWNCRIRRSYIFHGAVSARMDADDDDFRLSSLEQEAFVNGSQVVGASGLQPTMNKLSKWVFAVLFGIILLWRHDAEALWASIGSVLNSALSHILKRMFNQKRPFPTSSSDPGMPSSHAQSIFYIITFTIVSVVQDFGQSGLTAALGGLILALGCYFAWLRVSQRNHTISQVVVGATIGLGFSIFWVWVWDAIMLEAFISLIWVRMVVVLAAAGLCSGFLIYVIRYWILDR